MAMSERALRTRQQILDAARGEFRTEGFQNASVDRVADAAGVSKGSVYRYFTSKGGLYLSVLRSDTDDFLAGCEFHVRRTKELPADERIRDLWRTYYKLWLDQPETFELFWAMDNLDLLGELPEGLADEVTRDWRKSLKLTQSIIEEGIQRGELLPIDAWQVAQSFSNLANSLIEQDSKRHRRLIRARPLHETYEFSIELLLTGILVDRSRSAIVSDADELAD